MHPLAPYPVFSGRRFSFWASSNFFGLILAVVHVLLNTPNTTPYVSLLIILLYSVPSPHINTPYSPRFLCY